MNCFIDHRILDELSLRAQINPRLRMNLDLRNSELDMSQRMLNAIEPGTNVPIHSTRIVQRPIHRHRFTSETVVCLRGRLEWEYYDDQAHRCTERIELSPGGPVVALNMPAGQWHTVRALDPAP